MDDYIKQLEATGNFRIIKRLKPASHYFKDNETKKKNWNLSRHRNHGFKFGFG